MVQGAQPSGWEGPDSGWFWPDLPWGRWHTGSTWLPHVLSPQNFKLPKDLKSYLDQVSLIGVTAGVRDVRVEGRSRLILSPTIPHLPFVGGLQLLFLERPRVQFSFQGAARLADKLPAIQEKVVDDLEEELSKEVVWPNRIVLPLSSAADPRQVSRQE